MHEESYKRFIECSFFGYAYHSIIQNDQGRPEDYEFVEVNAGFEKMTGLKAENILGRRVTEVLPGIQDSSFDWIGFYGRIALEQTEEEFEQYSEPLKRWYKVSAYSPKKHHFVTIIQDITSEKEYALQMERFFSVNLDLLCIADTAGNFIKVNKEWENVLGFTVHELEQRTFLEFVHPDDVESTLAVMSELDEQKQVLQFVNRYRCKDGSYRHIEWRSHPHGALIYAAARDVTERKRMEEKLAVSEDRFSRAIAGTGAGLWDWDMVEDTVYFSPLWKSMLGYEDHEIENNFSGWRNLWHPEDTARIEKAINDHLEERTTTYEIEHRMRHKDGSWRWILTRGDIHKNSAGKMVRWVGTNIDITERKRDEEKLNEYAQQVGLKNVELDAALIRAEQAGRAKSEFLANMSHEVRTPMNAIMGMSCLLLDTELTSRQKEYALSIQRNSEALLRLISDILDISRIEREKLSLDIDEFNLQSFLEQLASEFQAKARKKNLEFTFDADPELNCLVSGDEQRIRQILANLLDNAVKFTPRGHVEFSAQMLEEEKKPHSGGRNMVTLDFEVRDSGIGISADKLDHIFEKFSQADSSSVREYGGTGLGLAVAGQLALIMGGDIRVASKPGQGSSFRFTVILPRLKTNERHSPREESLPREPAASDLKAASIESGSTLDLAQAAALARETADLVDLDLDLAWDKMQQILTLPLPRDLRAQAQKGAALLQAFDTDQARQELEALIVRMKAE